MTHSSFIKTVAAALLFTMTAGFSVTAAAVPSFTTGKALHRGDCIGITGTATAAEDIDIPALKQRLGEEGFSVKVMPTVTKRYGYFSGTDAERAGDLNELFADDSVAAILCLDGGYGSARILNKLDYDMIRTHAKPFIGFSDTTALHIALEEKSKIITFHGPMANTLSGIDKNDYTWHSFKKALTASQPLGTLSLPEGCKLTALIPGTATGILAGGNLSIIASLAGTPYALQGKGKILVLEDVNEPSYKIDRMLNQLWQSGLLQDVEAIAYGNFINCPADPGDFTTEEILAYYAALAGKPAIKGLPVGHGTENATLPLGTKALLQSDKENVTLAFIEPALHT